VNLIVFDIDGTLIQYHRKKNDAAYVRAIKDVLGLEIEDSWSDFVTSTDSGILYEIAGKHLKRSCPPSEIANVRQRMEHWLELEYAQEPFRETLGAIETWNSLKVHQDTCLAVATGNWEFSGRFKLGSAGFELGSVPIASADDSIHRVEILKVAFERALRDNGGEAFGRVIYVGDWIWDLRAANALSWEFIGIGNEETEKVLKAEGAGRVLRDFRGLLEKI
jgi:phosphoglycolate phosphatase-like HAD superfamily hydrolase